MVKKLVLLASLVSTTVLAENVTSQNDFDSFKNSNRIKYQDAVCSYQTRCGFKTACNFACLFVSTAPVGKWWKAAAVQKAGQWCGDLCEKVEECKDGYFCDAY